MKDEAEAAAVFPLGPGIILPGSLAHRLHPVLKVLLDVVILFAEVVLDFMNFVIDRVLDEALAAFRQLLKQFFGHFFVIFQSFFPDLLEALFFSIFLDPIFIFLKHLLIEILFLFFSPLLFGKLFFLLLFFL